MGPKFPSCSATTPASMASFGLSMSRPAKKKFSSVKSNFPNSPRPRQKSPTSAKKSGSPVTRSPPTPGHPTPNTCSSIRAASSGITASTPEPPSNSPPRPIPAKIQNFRQTASASPTYVSTICTYIPSPTTATNTRFSTRKKPKKKIKTSATPPKKATS